MSEIYNISPDCKSQWYTADQIRAAAVCGVKLMLNLGDRYAPVPCRLAATVKGWCTVALTDDNFNVYAEAAILQDWAGSFVCV